MPFMVAPKFPVSSGFHLVPKTQLSSGMTLLQSKLLCSAFLKCWSHSNEFLEFIFFWKLSLFFVLKGYFYWTWNSWVNAYVVSSFTNLKCFPPFHGLHGFCWEVCAAGDHPPVQDLSVFLCDIKVFSLCLNCSGSSTMCLITIRFDFILFGVHWEP